MKWINLKKARPSEASEIIIRIGEGRPKPWIIACISEKDLIYIDAKYIYWKYIGETEKLMERNENG